MEIRPAVRPGRIRRNRPGIQLPVPDAQERIPAEFPESEAKARQQNVTVHGAESAPTGLWVLSDNRTLTIKRIARITSSLLQNGFQLSYLRLIGWNRSIIRCDGSILIRILITIQRLSATMVSSTSVGNSLFVP